MFFEIEGKGYALGVSHRSHKLVAAAQIMAIQHEEGDGGPFTRLLFKDKPYIEMRDPEFSNRPHPEAGWYLVIYSDGYFSFSPGKQFEEGYTAIESLEQAVRGVGVANGIGWAIKEMHNGNRVRRVGWNGKGMFLFLVPGSRFKVNRPPLLGIYEEGTEIDYCPHVDMKTADGKVVPWLASQTDLLALDWELAN